MSPEVKQKKWKIKFKTVAKGGSFSIGSHKIEASSLNAAKRQIPHVTPDETHWPDLTKAIRKSKPRWRKLSKYRSVCYYEINAKDRDPELFNVLGYKIYISRKRSLKPFIWIGVAALLAMMITFGAIAYNRYKNDDLRIIFTSRYPEYGKRVLKIYKDGAFNIRKLNLITQEFNKQVCGLDRNYMLVGDSDNMIRMLTQNQYRLEYSYLYKTLQYKEQRNEQSTDQRD